MIEFYFIMPAEVGLFIYYFPGEKLFFNKKTEPFSGFCLFTFSLVFNFNDFFLIVASACFTNSVRHHQGAAFAAFYQVRSTHLPVCTSFIASCFRCFVLWTYGHRLHLLKFTKYITDSCHAGILRLLCTSAGTVVEVFPTLAADAFAVISAEDLQRPAHQYLLSLIHI